MELDKNEDLYSKSRKEDRMKALDEFRSAAEAVGYTEERIARLADPDLLRDVMAVIDGTKEIINVDLWIVTDREPLVPFGLSNSKLHDRSLGRWAWNQARFQLYRSKKQEDGGKVGGHRLMRWLKKRRKFNACVLDYLHRRPRRLPPSSWEWLRENPDRRIFFLGTTYADDQAYPCVRGLKLNQNGELIYCYRRLTAYFGPNDAFALVAE